MIWVEGRTVGLCPSQPGPVPFKAPPHCLVSFRLSYPQIWNINSDSLIIFQRSINNISILLYTCKPKSEPFKVQAWSSLDWVCPYNNTRMHSSRMHTVRCSDCLGGGCLPGGYLPMGYLPMGVSALEGVCLVGVSAQIPPTVNKFTDRC